jgi:hypothetical protein
LFSSRSISILLAFCILAAIATAQAPQARASQQPCLSITVQGPNEGYQGDGFYLSYVTNDTGQDMLRVTNVTITLDRGVVPVNVGLGTLWPRAGWEWATVWVQMPTGESIGLHPFTASFAYQTFNNQTGNWTTASNSPIVITESLLVLPSPTTLNLTQLLTALPISIALALAGTVLVVSPKMRKTKNSRLPIYSIPLFSLAATIGSTLHLSSVQMATLCHPGIVGGGFPLPWIPFQYYLEYHGPLFACPFGAANTAAIFSPLFFLIDLAFYTLIVMVVGLAFPPSRNAVARWWTTFRIHSSAQDHSQDVERSQV